jgi:hypothetical protein
MTGPNTNWQGLVGSTSTYDAIYGNGVTPSASNSSLYIARNGTSALLGGSATVYLYVGGIVATATSTGLAVTGALSATGTVTAGIAEIGTSPYHPGYAAWGSTAFINTAGYALIQNNSSGAVYLNAPTGQGIHLGINDGADVLTVTSGSVVANGIITSNATGTAINAPNGNISAQGAASTGGEVIGGTAAIGTANYNSTYGWVGLSGKNGASNATDFGILFDATGSPNLNSSASSSGYILAAGIQEANWNTASFNFTEPVTFNGIVARQSYNRNTSAITGNVTVSTLYSVISLEPGSSNPTTLTTIPNGTVDGQQLTLIQNAPTTCVVSSSNLVATFSLTTGSSRNLTWNNANSKWL